MQLAGEEDASRPTCQVLPPNFPAHRRYCPYTLDRHADGSWTAPDLARGDPTGRGVGDGGGACDALGPPRHRRHRARPVPGGAPRVARLPRPSPFLLQATDLLGFAPALPDVASRCVLQRCLQAGVLTADPSGRVEADYPAASDFIEPLFSCRVDVQHRSLLRPELDRRIRRALQLQRTEIAGANRLWTELDREITNKALWVPLYNVYGADLVSKRVGNYQYNPRSGALLSQLWVR